MSTQAAHTTAYPDEIAAADREPATEPERRIFADRVAHLYRQSNLGIVLTLLVGVIITVELWTPRYSDVTIMWWLITIAIAAARYGLYRGYLERTDQDDEKWLRWVAIGALAAGVNWGIASAVFFPSHTDDRQVFLAFILAGLISGGIAIFASVWWSYAIYAAGIVIPFTYVLATSGNPLFADLSFLVPLFYVANVAW